MSAVHTLPFSPGSDLAFEIYVPPARDPSTGALLAFPGLTITGYVSEASAPTVALNGTVKTFTRFAEGRFIWLFDAAELAACLAQVSPAPADGKLFFAVAEAPSDFRIFRRLSYRAVRDVP